METRPTAVAMFSPVDSASEEAMSVWLGESDGLTRGATRAAVSMSGIARSPDTLAAALALALAAARLNVRCRSSLAAAVLCRNSDSGEATEGNDARTPAADSSPSSKRWIGSPRTVPSPSTSSCASEASCPGGQASSCLLEAAADPWGAGSGKPALPFFLPLLFPLSSSFLSAPPPFFFLPSLSAPSLLSALGSSSFPSPSSLPFLSFFRFSLFCLFSFASFGTPGSGEAASGLSFLRDTQGRVLPAFPSCLAGALSTGRSGCGRALVGGSEGTSPGSIGQERRLPSPVASRSEPGSRGGSAEPGPRRPSAGPERRSSSLPARLEGAAWTDLTRGPERSLGLRLSWGNRGSDTLLPTLRMLSVGPSFGHLFFVAKLYERRQSFLSSVASSICMAVQTGESCCCSSEVRYGGPQPTVPWRYAERT
mmetsp:Transcript_26094/g.75329  ORF Transcript_26094/g.75329 Transcript_26094/m.75329 type:complete len:424 (-) Transcript_26094:2359-3630(-)